MQKISYLFFLLLTFSACDNVTHTNNVSQTTSARDSNNTGHADNITPATDTTTTRKSVPAVPFAATYRLISLRDSIRHALKYFSPQQVPVLLAVNRVDSAHIAALPKLLVPDSMVTDVSRYSPFPSSVPALQQVNKIVFFSYPAEYFGAYEHGQLVHTGPTNMGRQKDSTPTGLFFANWKAKDTHSTFNDEWDLKWNVNIDNKAGIGWHQYTMPGYPVSHSCLRLNEADAQALYDWVDEWINSKSGLQAQGTPVVVFGSYPFGKPKPWLQLASDPHALDISPDQLLAQVQPHMTEIMKEQQKRRK